MGFIYISDIWYKHNLGIKNEHRWRSGVGCRLRSGYGVMGYRLKLYINYIYEPRSPVLICVQSIPHTPISICTPHPDLHLYSLYTPYPDLNLYPLPQSSSVFSLNLYPIPRSQSAPHTPISICTPHPDLHLCSVFIPKLGLYYISIKFINPVAQS